ncbi:MAG: T9SS type A sorting domain-containing protein, partial [Bacteroidota bacterium]
TVGGPFRLIYPNTREETLIEGEEIEIIWDVANTTASPINCATVDIMLSYNNGFTYLDTLANDVPNIGSARVSIPVGRTTRRARVKVKAANNVFFDISDDLFSIEPGMVSTEDLTEQMKGLELLPNPAQDQLWLRLAKNAPTSREPAQVTIFNMQGKAQQKQVLSEFQQAQKIDIGQLKPGIYLLQLTQRDQRYVRKLVVQ